MPNQSPPSGGGLDLSAIGPPPTPPDAEAVRLAQLEQEFLYEGKRRDHKRTQTIKDAINIILVIGVVLAAVATVILGAIKLAHMTLPKSSLWLSDAQMSGIDAMLKYLGSSVVGGLVSKRLSKSFS